MSDQTNDLSGFFQSVNKKQGKKKKKKTAAAQEPESTKVGMGIEEEAPKEDIKHQAEDFAPESDDENKHDELLHIADGLKNFNDEEAKKKRAQDAQAKENGGFGEIFKEDPKKKMEGPVSENAPAKKATGPPRFDRAKGPPTFTRGAKGSAAINKNEFPDLGDFPSMDASAAKSGGSTFKTQGMAAAEQDMRPKCEQSGSFQMNTVMRAPRTEAGGD